MNIGLLGCDDVPERFRHVSGTYRDMFEALLRPELPNARFTWFDVTKGELPEWTNACDAYLCTGSRYSVYEQRDWIAALKHFVRELYRARETYVGICFGHQILAEALGGKVARAEQGWGIGVHGMAVVKLEPWMQPERANCKLQYMHADQVQALPPESVLLAEAEHCPIAMFRTGTMLGIEGHPEFTAAYEQVLLLDRRERIGAERVDAALASLSAPTDEHAVASWISNFLVQPKSGKS